MAETPALNIQEAMVNFGGDENSLLEFLREWNEGRACGLTLRLHKGIMKENFEEIRIGSHILLSGAGWKGATRMFDLLRILETRGERKEPMSLILNDYLEFLHRKVSKEIATIPKRPVPSNMAAWDIFEKHVREAFPEDFPPTEASPICQGCNIF